MSLDPAWAPQGESPSDIFLERTFMAGDVITGLGYGIQLCMFVYCASYLWQQRKTRRHAFFMLAYIAAIFIVETLYVAVQARTVQICYIDNRNYPGGPWQFFLATQNLPVNVMFYATLFLITFFCDCLVLWRCWVIWTASGHRTAYAVTCLPALMVLASFIMGTLWTLQSSQPGLSFYSALPLAYGTSYYAVSLSINIFLTFLIVVRLLLYRRAVIAAMPLEHARHYLLIVTVLVESAALYSVFALLFLITYALNNPINQIMLGVAQATQQISTYMILYRLADGSAWRTSTLKETLTTVQFAARPVERETRTNSTAHSSDAATSNEEPSTVAPGSPTRSTVTLSEKDSRGGLHSGTRNSESNVAKERGGDSPV